MHTKNVYNELSATLIKFPKYRDTPRKRISKFAQGGPLKYFTSLAEAMEEETFSDFDIFELAVETRSR